MRGGAFRNEEHSCLLLQFLCRMVLVYSFRRDVVVAKKATKANAEIEIIGVRGSMQKFAGAERQRR